MVKIMSDYKIIARNQIYNDIKEIILENDHKSHFISIVGKGGTGKTTLLYNLMEELENYSGNQKLLIVNFDYRDLLGQSTAGTFLYVILKLLSKFEGIFSESEFLEFLGLMLKSEVTFQELLQFAESALTKLYDEDIRIVLLEDTLEIIKAPSDYIHNAFSVGALIPNCVAIVACRPENNAIENLSNIRKILSNKKWVIHKPFELISFNFFETQEFLGDSLPTDLQEKIYLLTQGSPIHLAITLEILKNNVHLEIFNKNINELTNEFEKSPKKLFQIFEYELLGKISKLKTNLDWALLILSYLNRRYDKKILKIFLDVSDRELENLESKIKSLRFLRKSTMPNRYHKELLHDEMQRMINENLWEDIDFDGSHRKLLAQKIVDEYYIPEIDNLKQNMTILESKLDGYQNIIDYWNMSIDLAELQNESLDYKYRINHAIALNYLDSLIKDAKNNKLGNLAKLLLFNGVVNIDLYNIVDKKKLREKIWEDS